MIERLCVVWICCWSLLSLAVFCNHTFVGYVSRVLVFECLPFSVVQVLQRGPKNVCVWTAKHYNNCTSLYIQIGTSLIRNLYSNLNSNGTQMCGVARKFTGHIYGHATLHSCSSSESCEQFWFFVSLICLHPFLWRGTTLKLYSCM